MHAGWLGAAEQVDDAIHVLSGGAWVGALVPLLLVASIGEQSAHRVSIGLALRRFSLAGHIAVALVVASGVVNTMLILGEWPVHWSSPYQLTLGCKIALVAAMIALAPVNRYGVPRVIRHSGNAAQAIRLGIAAEMVLAACVIGLVSFFGMVAPS
jgi:putative copper resistance protein D